MSCAKLGGCLIGYGLKTKNGEFKKVILDKPISNTITKHCLNNLLTFDGSNAVPTTNVSYNTCSLFVKTSQPSERYGVINSCALGDGTGATSTNDTDLKHRVSAQTETKKTGSAWCGTIIDRENAVLKLRISHIHAISEDFTIKEIGWYNATYPDLNYTLSARVQLEEFVDVHAGDEFYSIYELSVGFQGVEKFTNFAGIAGCDGIKTNSYIDANQRFTSFPSVSSAGYGTNDNWGNNANYDANLFNIVPAWSSINTGVYKICTSNINKLKPFLGEGGQTSIIVARTLKNYANDTFYRDTEIIINADSLINIPIYSLAINGVIYRFGTFDDNNNFTPSTFLFNSGLKLVHRQSWSTDLLTPAG